MFLLGFRRKLTALVLCKSIESAIQWLQIHHRITFATMQNPAVYLSGARVSIFFYLGSPTIPGDSSIFTAEAKARSTALASGVKIDELSGLHCILI